jgi:hypothetical protein
MPTSTRELSGRELILAVRDVIRDNPSRHMQTTWLITPHEATAGEIRLYADEPVPDQPSNPERPICQTVGCVAGWAATLHAPKSATLGNGVVYLDRMRSADMAEYARDAMGLSDDTANWLFAAYRTTSQVVDALGYLADHPDTTGAGLYELFPGGVSL